MIDALDSPMYCLLKGIIVVAAASDEKAKDDFLESVCSF